MVDVVEFGPSHVHDRVVIDEAFLGAVPVEPTDGREPSADRRSGLAFGLGPTGVQFDVSSLDREHVGVERVKPCQPLAQVEAVGLDPCQNTRPEIRPTPV